MIHSVNREQRILYQFCLTSADFFFSIGFSGTAVLYIGGLFAAIMAISVSMVIWAKQTDLNGKRGD
jgi:hypothetical protein